MATIPSLLSSNDNGIRQQTAPNSITEHIVADRLDAILFEVRDRGIKTAANTGALGALNNTEALFAFVPGTGLLYWDSTGTPNGSTIFAGSTGVWKLLTVAGSGGTGGGSGPEAAVTDAYADAVGASSGERAALQAFTSAAVSGGWYSKLVMFNPFVGTSEILKRRNMLDPTDSDGAFRLQKTGTITSNANGVSIPNTSGADKYTVPIDPTLIIGQPNVGIGIYVKNPTQFQIYGGHANLTIIGYNSSAIWCGIASPSSGDEASSTNAYKQHFYFQRIDTSTLQIWNQGTLLASPSRVSSGLPANPIDLYIRNDEATPMDVSCFYISQKLTNTEAGSLNTALNTLMAALGR